MSIEVRSVTKRFGATLALDDVSLTLEEGKIYGLLGNNGAGKSTLLNIMTNRLFADRGAVTVDGEDVRNNDAALSRLFLMSENNLYPDDMRVRRAFETAALFYPGFQMDNALELSEIFGLNTKKKITALSTGYASIFRIIVALSVNAPYLLLDEPVLGLDAQHRDLFYQKLIEKFAAGGCTVVISTHLISEVAGLIEHAIIIRNGRILRDCGKDALLSGCCTITGPAEAVDRYLAGRSVLTVSTLGGLRTACVQVEDGEEPLPAGLERGAVNLQDYFIHLMNAEEKANA